MNSFTKDMQVDERLGLISEKLEWVAGKISDDVPGAWLILKDIAREIQVEGKNISNHAYRVYELNKHESKNKEDSHE